MTDMDTPHGIGVNWLHPSHRGTMSPRGKVQDVRNEQPGPQASQGPPTPPPKPQTESDSPAHHHSLRPHLHHQEPPTRKGGKEKGQASPSLPRRTSWISNLSSKFSSSASASPESPVSSPVKALPTPSKEDGDSATGSVLVESKSPDSAQQPSPSASPSPSPTSKSSGQSFIQSALRRLSSAGSAGLGKASGSGSLCPRRVMNVDPYRERCQVENVQPGRLRRVSFCVDVQIAAAASTEAEDTPLEKLTLGDLEEDDVTPSMDSYFKEYKPGQIDKLPGKKSPSSSSLKAKEMSEGAALKHPDSLVHAKVEPDKASVSNVDEAGGVPASTDEGHDGEHSKKKKEKKKRSEEERKERKEKRKQQAVANGTVPIELTLEAPSAGSTSGDSSPPHTQQSKPTTDPLRIYKRCCQLRESHALKRIADQLTTAPNGTVPCFDLTGLRFSLPDVVTFGDFLAIVPVRRLNLQDCGLTDEALRVILAGLLSVKTPQQADFNRNLSKHNSTPKNREMEQFGVIEKLCLKNNSKLSREGWRHLGYFIHMSQSIKAIDLTGVPFPQPSTNGRRNSQSQSGPKSPNVSKPPVEMCNVFGQCLAKRLAGSRLEELILAGCDLNDEALEKIVDAYIFCGGKRLSLAKNKLTERGAHAVVRYLESGKCEALDLGGNDLSYLSDDLIAPISRTAATNPLYALSLEGCNLSTTELKTWLPSLTSLTNFRFLDLSHNQRLFAKQPNSVGVLRRYLPQMTLLKRLNINDVALEPDHCIAIAEILPEMPVFAHLSLLENPAISALASAKEEAAQEEACAVYASLMTAARVSKTVVSIEVDIPSKDSGEIVQALAKQVVAYCLRNMESGAIDEVAENADNGSRSDRKYVEVPEVLLHLVGHSDDNPENHDNDEPAPDEDYIVSGTGVVKALSVCLGNKAADIRRPSRDFIRPSEDSANILEAPAAKKTGMKAMSMNMLDSARKIRSRLQPALTRACTGGDDEMSLKKLQFLDSTLKRIVEQFENEYPECRPQNSLELSPTNFHQRENGVLSPNPMGDSLSRTTSRLAPPDDDDDNPDDDEPRYNGRISRRGSDMSLASKSLANEEGRVHRIGQQVRREVYGNMMDKGEPPDSLQHDAELRSKFEALSGDELKAQLENFESNDKAELIEELIKKSQAN